VRVSAMHSSPAEVTIEVPAPPEPSRLPPSDFPEQGPPSKKSISRIIAIAAAVIVLALIALVALRRKTAAPNPAQLAGGGGSYGVLRLKGTTEAVESRTILAPVLAGQQMSSLTLTRLAAGGSHVKRGDLLAEFDRQAQVRDFLDHQAEYNKFAEQVAEEQAKEMAAKAKDETELKQAEDNLRKAELEIQKQEIVSRIDAEKNQENLEDAKATYQQLQETFELKRNAAKAGIRIVEIQRDRARETMLHSEANADLMRIESPIDGVVVRNSIWKDGGTMAEVQEGDHIDPGQGFLQVIDPSAMQVRVLANQVDFLQLQAGQRARVRLDAYPDLVFSAEMGDRAPIAQEGAFSVQLRTFVVLFSVQGSDPKLMPDLSAAVDVDVAEHDAAKGGS
jgi:HlyD family secretion protein